MYLYSAELKKHMHLSKENHVCYTVEHIAHCVPVRIELVLKGILPAQQGFQWGEMHILFQIVLFR
jgi:hypothetical protein